MIASGRVSLPVSSREPRRLLSARTAGEGDPMSIVIEIRAAEGGDDAKALVKEQVSLYARLATRREL